MWDGYIEKFLPRLFGFWLSLVLKETMVPGRSFNLPASKCLFTGESQIQGRGPGGPPPLFLNQTVARRAEKNFFRPPHPPYLKVWMIGSPVIWRSGSANAGTLQRPSNFPITIVASVASGISRLNQPTYIILALRFNSSNWFCLRVIPFSSAVPIGLKLNTSYDALSNKDSRISGVKRWCSGTVPEHGTLGTLTCSHSFFIYPR